MMKQSYFLGGVLVLCCILVACGDAATSAPGGTSAAALPTSGSSGATAVNPGGATTAKLKAGATAANPSGKLGALDACALLTQAEVEAALGDKVNAPKAADRGASCDYTGVTGQIPPQMAIQLQAGSPSSFALLKKMSGVVGGVVSTLAPGLDTALPSVVGDMATIETVPGLGDDAFWNGGTSNMWVLTGNREFSIQVLKFGSTSTGGSFIAYKPTITALSQRAVARLKGAPVPNDAIVAPATPTIAADMKTVLAMMSAPPITIAPDALTAAAGLSGDMSGLLATNIARLTAIANATPPAEDATETPAADATEPPTP